MPLSSKSGDSVCLIIHTAWLHIIAVSGEDSCRTLEELERTAFVQMIRFLSTDLLNLLQFSLLSSQKLQRQELECTWRQAFNIIQCN